MSQDVVPAEVRVAAKRGFIRTACQSLSAAIPGTGVALVLSADWLLAVGLGSASALLTALMAGSASYFSIIANGVPEDYAAAAAVGKYAAGPDSPDEG